MAIEHIGIIMDGNRRYAKKHLLDPLKGHDKGAKRVREVIDTSIKNGIKELSLYTFSSKNFNRSKAELEHLFSLFVSEFEKLKDEDSKDVRICFAGRKELFPERIHELMNQLEEQTRTNTLLKVNFCMGYDGKEEIVESIKKCSRKGLEIDDANITENLWIENPVDLIIRTSGEKRISGFLLWHSSYAEFYFTDLLWPQFSSDEYQKAIDDYNSRHRRFGR